MKTLKAATGGFDITHRLKSIVLLITVLCCGLCNVNAQSTAAEFPKDTIAKEPSKAKEFFLNLTQKLGLSGYTQVRYQYFFEENKFNSFDIRRARLDLKGSVVKDKIGYRLQVDLAGVPKILDANVSYAFNKYLKITVGEAKIPFSLENLAGSPVLITINRSQVVEALTARSRDVIGNHNGRDIGLILSGGVAGKKEFNILEYAVGIFNGSGINNLDNNQAKDFSGRVVLQPVKGLVVGGSYYNGDGNWSIKDTAEVDVFANRNRDRFGAEISFVKPRYAASAEFIRGEDDATTKQGFYIQASGYPVKDKLQLVFKYDWYDSNTDKEENASTHYIFGINYYINKYARIQAHYQLAAEEGAKIDNDIVALMFQLGF